MILRRDIHRAEIWLVDFGDAAVGHEIQKIRPALVIGTDNVGVLPLVPVVPITGWKDSFSHNPVKVFVPISDINHLRKDSAIDVLQVHAWDIERFLGKLGIVEPDIMLHVDTALRLLFSLPTTAVNPTNTEKTDAP